ncbi:unnamed protein product, partial [Ectocarpus sp. 8 AP-2014]
QTHTTESTTAKHTRALERASEQPSPSRFTNKPPVLSGQSRAPPPPPPPRLPLLLLLLHSKHLQQIYTHKKSLCCPCRVAHIPRALRPNSFLSLGRPFVTITSQSRSGAHTEV